MRTNRTFQITFGIALACIISFTSCTKKNDLIEPKHANASPLRIDKEFTLFSVQSTLTAHSASTLAKIGVWIVNDSGTYLVRYVSSLPTGSVLTSTAAVVNGDYVVLPVSSQTFTLTLPNSSTMRFIVSNPSGGDIVSIIPVALNQVAVMSSGSTVTNGPPLYQYEVLVGTAEQFRIDAIVALPSRTASNSLPQ